MSERQARIDISVSKVDTETQSEDNPRERTVTSHARQFVMAGKKGVLEMMLRTMLEQISKVRHGGSNTSVRISMKDALISTTSETYNQYHKSSSKNMYEHKAKITLLDPVLD